MSKDRNGLLREDNKKHFDFSQNTQTMVLSYLRHGKLRRGGLDGAPFFVC